MGRRQISSFDELELSVEDYAKLAMTEVIDEVFQVLYDYIHNEIYMKQTLKFQYGFDTYYRQTEQFLRAFKKDLVKIKDDVVIGRIYFDAKSISSEIRSYTLFNAHANINGSEVWSGHGYTMSVAEWLPFFISEGINSPYYTHKGIGFIGMIEDYLDKNFDKIFLKAIKQQDIVVR